MTGLSPQRRNTITRADSQVIAAIAAVAAILAALSDAAPTGQAAIDALLVAATAAAVTWLASTAPWWALVAGSGIMLTASLGGPLALTAIALVALAAGGWLGWTTSNRPYIRAAIGAIVVQVALRIEWNPFFLSSALIAAAALGIIAVPGLLRRQRYIRKRVYWTLAGTLGLVVLATVAMAVGASQAQSTARDGYAGLLDGLDQLDAGDSSAASDTLRQAAADLDAAHGDLDGPLTQPARLVPGLAQNRNTSAEVVESASAAANAAADALAIIDLDRLRISAGTVDLAALTDLQQPLADLSATVDDLRVVLDEADSPWLVAPIQNRLATVTTRADQAAHQAKALAATAEIAPAMLGADGPRTYLLAFVNTAEARGTGGLMGNWSEVTVDNGTMRVTDNGRSADLQTDSLRDLRLDVSPEYLTRYSTYGAAGAANGGGVVPKFWSNVTMPADMANTASPIAQMYEQATGQAVDGVFVIDPAGLGALVDVVGSIDVPQLDRSFNGDELRDFLLLEQYDLEESEREDLLESITEITIKSVLSDKLPKPQDLVSELANPALHGHISGWATRPDEEQLFEMVGMDALLPVTTTSGTDALAIVNNNASGNKIENFLERTIDYRPIVDQNTGVTTATLTIELTNTAPTVGYPDYVIGNIIDAPIGTNRMLVDVYSKLDVDAIRLDGDDTEVSMAPELGYTVYRTLLSIPPGKTAVLELELSGNVGPGPYQLAYRPQALPNNDQLSINATTSGGNEIFSFEGELQRRSLLSASGVTAWRADTQP